jgi:hypothetical protein
MEDYFEDEPGRRSAAKLRRLSAADCGEYRQAVDQNGLRRVLFADILGEP